MTKTCTIANCGKISVARGLCKTHYQCDYSRRNRDKCNEIQRRSDAKRAQRVSKTPTGRVSKSHKWKEVDVDNAGLEASGATWRWVALTKGARAAVDDIDFEAVRAISWSVSGLGYGQSDGVGMIHRFIAERAGMSILDLDVDHIDGNPTNNRRSNLRVATRSENLHNQEGHRDRKSRFKGVTLVKGKWHATIMCRGVSHHFGPFDLEEEAGAAYAEAAVRLHGTFAKY